MKTATTNSRLKRTRGADLNFPDNRPSTLPKRTRGRPSYDPGTKQTLYIARWASRRGATLQQLADLLNVAKARVDEWMLVSDEFRAAVLEGGLEAFDAKIERSLAERAAGYTVETEKAFTYQGEIIKTTIRENVLPDVGAITLWLKNRQPGRWRDQQEIAFTGVPELADERRAAMAVVQLFQMGLMAAPDLPSDPATVEHESEEDDDEDPLDIG